MDPKPADLTPANSTGGRSKRSRDDESKKRKIQRACDACRKKKIKCDGPQNSLSTSRCAYCHELGLDCTYVESTTRRGPPKGYVETLEQKCGRLERVLGQLHPGVDFTPFVGPALDRDEFDINQYRQALHSLKIPPYPAIKPLGITALSPTSTPIPNANSSSSSSTSPSAGVPFPAIHEITHPSNSFEVEPDTPEDAEELAHDANLHVGIAEGMSRLELSDWNSWYHGKASDAHLQRKLIELKYQVAGGYRDILEGINQRKRALHWDTTEWEMTIAEEQLRPIDYANWPDRGLDQKLIDAYFDHQNIMMPLLNRRLFQRQFNAGLWETDHGFAKVCLSVFANGAKYVDDRRVWWPSELSATKEGRERLAGYKENMLRHSAGWRYIRAVLRMGRSIMRGPTIYDLQTDVLLCTFLVAGSSPRLAWVMASSGLRSAQEIGLHMRASMLHANPSERALFNRAFWCIYHCDRTSSVFAGRAVGLYDSDFDASYPADVDDEFWETGDLETDFKQPEGRGPSRVSAFIQTLKLDRIISAALRTIYSLSRLTGERADPAAQRAIVVKLDLALNTWADNVPHGLRWDPDRADFVTFQQSALLYIHYYYCQILVHRQYIPTPTQPDTGLPALAICANAARSTSNILDVWMRRSQYEGLKPGCRLPADTAFPAWICSIIHNITIYSGPQTAEERAIAMKGLQTCEAALKDIEMTFREVGKHRDVVLEVTDEECMPPVGPWKKSVKRARGAEESEIGGQQSNAAAGNQSGFSEAELATQLAGSFAGPNPLNPHPSSAALSNQIPFVPLPSFLSADANSQLTPAAQPLYLPNHFQVPMSSDEQMQLFNSLMGMNTFESQFVDMNLVGAQAEMGQRTGGGAGIPEGQLENDWWAQLFSDYM
ncbi:hypothetical protein IAT38_000438 [Cryptococcus sp. DSM 104549]